MNALFIAVDGGGTSSRYRIADQDHRILWETVSDAANIRLGATRVFAAIQAVITRGLQELTISHTLPLYAVVGLAGLESQTEKDIFLRSSHPFTKLMVTSDAHIACYGAHQGKDGAIIITGTGAIGYHIENGTSHRVGGWGFPLDDFGGGAQLGLALVQATFEALDGRASFGNATRIMQERWPTSEALFEAFEKATPSQFAALAPLLSDSAKQGDELAASLLQQAAQSIDRIYHAQCKMQQTKLPLCVFGGLAKTLLPLLNEATRSSLARAKGDALDGAMQLARQIACT